jgi:hypothetical protein
MNHRLRIAEFRLAHRLDTGYRSGRDGATGNDVVTSRIVVTAATDLEMLGLADLSAACAAGGLATAVITHYEGCFSSDDPEAGHGRISGSREAVMSWAQGLRPDVIEIVEPAWVTPDHWQHPPGRTERGPASQGPCPERRAGRSLASAALSLHPAAEQNNVCL